MDLTALRGMVSDITLATLGVDATVTRPAPDTTPIATRVVWQVRPLDEQRPYGTDFQRRDPRGVLALPLSAVDRVPRGTLIDAPGPAGGDSVTWVVDETDKVEGGYIHVIVRREVVR